MIAKHKVFLAIIYTLKKEKKETLNHKLLASYQKFNFFSLKNYKLPLQLIVKINISFNEKYFLKATMPQCLHILKSKAQDRILFILCTNVTFRKQQRK